MFSDALVTAFMIISLSDRCLCVATRTSNPIESVRVWAEESNATAPLFIDKASPDAFPICTDYNGPFAPFCLPRDGADVVVDATYYTTWNADYYPLNASITIEMRYSNSTTGDSAFTSERTDNSYGYLPLYIRKEWLQGKRQNKLTLYLVELDPASGTRASVRKGPMITLHPKPTEHYKPSPPMAFNKAALYIGLPVSLGVVIIVVAGLFFGMRKSRRIGLGSVMGSRGKGYGVRKSKSQRLGRRNCEIYHPDAATALRKYADEVDSGSSDVADSDIYNEVERNARFTFRQDSAKLKSLRRQ
ncbi:hypothetical protein BBP40_008012 [Aspergillus hancockii]|nr:hypothetical protein BBP40_008012 [Aspergillus hancockii]